MGTRHQGNIDEIRALDAFIKLARAAESVGSEVQHCSARYGLTQSQFAALEALYHLGPMCQREVGNKLLRSSGNITLVIDNLEKHGLVRRERDQNDRRMITIHLTDAGRRLIGEIFPAHVAVLKKIFASLTATEQEQLAALCKKLGLAAEASASPLVHETAPGSTSKR